LILTRFHSCNRIKQKDLLPIPPSSQKFVNVIADSGCTNILLTSEAAAHTKCDNSDPPLSIRLPDNSILNSSGALDFQLCPDVNLKAHIVPGLQHSLFGLAPLTQQGCEVVLTNTDITITKNGETVMRNQKLPDDNLWQLPLALPEAKPAANLVIHNSTNAERIKFLHATFGSPPSSTLLRCVQKGWLDHFPQVPSAKSIAANMPNTIATAMGHLNLHRQGVRSTQSLSRTDSANFEYDEQHLNTDNCVYSKWLPIDTMCHSDLTGRLPVTSKSGKKYILVFVYKGYIHMEATATRTAHDYVAAHERAYQFYKSHGHTFDIMRLDNETSSDLEAFFKAANILSDYVPPLNHRANKAERGIQTVKNHFIATMSGANPAFPMYLWDECLDQMELTLSHLMPYALNPRLSAYQGIYGKPYDFSAHPIAPIGTLVVMHDSSTTRNSWAQHGTKGYYVGPAMKHYRSYNIWSFLTHKIRVSDSVAWFPEHVLMPGATLLEHVEAAILDFTENLRSLPFVVSVEVVDQQAYEGLTLKATNALRELVALFHKPSLQLDAQPLLVEQRVPPLEQRVRLDALSNPLGDPSSIPIPPAQLSATPNLLFPPSNNTGAPLRRSQRIAARQTFVGHTCLQLPLNLDVGGKPLTYSSAMQGPNKLLFEQAEEDEYKRLFTTGTWRAIHATDQPYNRRKDTTYFNPVPREKIKDGVLQCRIRGTIGGDRIHYDGEVAARTADMAAIKILLNSVVSDESEFMTLDIQDYYLCTPLQRSEYCRVRVDRIPPNIMASYELNSFVHNGSVIFEVNKGMYGLPQAGYLAQQILIPHLASHGFKQCDNTPCLFRHEVRQLAFSLVVDDFGVKYKLRQDAEYLIATLQKLYKVHIDWTGTKYLGFSIVHDKRAGQLTLSLPEYIPKALQRFGKYFVFRGAASPAIYTPPRYGAHTQVPFEDDSPLLSSADHTLLQEIVGVLAYYARAVDVSILTAVNDIASQQSRATQRVMSMAERLLNYVSSYPNNELVFHKCDMILYGQSDASYLSRSHSRSVAGSVFYLGNKSDPTRINGIIDASSKIISVVVASAAEAEYAGLFSAGQQAASLRQTLADLGHPQEPTLLLCDNECAVGIANDTVKAKRSKSIDMRYHWVRDRVRQGHFKVQWRRGAHNLADFFTKALPVHEHQRLLPFLTHTPRDPNALNLNARMRRTHKWQQTHPRANRTVALQ